MRWFGPGPRADGWSRSGVAWRRGVIEMAEQRQGENRYRTLPEPVRLEDTVTSVDVTPVQPEKDDYWREVEWMLKVTGGG
jgi:hypothetical protein